MLSLKGHKMTLYFQLPSAVENHPQDHFWWGGNNQKRNWIATSNNNSLRRRNKDECGERERNGWDISLVRGHQRETIKTIKVVSKE